MDSIEYKMGKRKLSAQHESDQEENSDCQQETRPKQATYTSNHEVMLRLGLQQQGTSKETIQNQRDLGKAYTILADLAVLFDADYMPNQSANTQWNNYYSLIDISRDRSKSYTKSCQSELEDKHVRAIIGMNESIHIAGLEGNRSYFEEREEERQALMHSIQTAKLAANAANDEHRRSFLGGSSGDATTALRWTLGKQLFALSLALNKALRPGWKAESMAFWAPKITAIATTIANMKSSSTGTTGTSLETLPAFTNVASICSAGLTIALGPKAILTNYIGPMLVQINKGLGGLQAAGREHNDGWTEHKGYPRDFQNEVGGVEMWNYMVRVMNAKYVEDTPEPAGEAYRYFDTHREQIQSYANKMDGETRHIPVDSDLMYPDVDPKAFRSWIYRSREKIWVMLYGSRDASKAVEV